MKLITSLALISLSLFSLFANQSAENTRAYVDSLRPQLATAFSNDLTIVRDHLDVNSPVGSYWLVHVRPKHTGTFVFKYRYKYNQPLYSHVERKLNLRVAPKGCRRGPGGNGLYARFCLGDTIILPIAIERFTEHTFSLNVIPWTPESDDTIVRTNNISPTSDIVNPVAVHLAFIGVKSHKSLRRNGGYTLEHHATFEGRRAGRFNIVLTQSDQRLVSTQPLVGGIPLIVTEPDTPITAIAQEHVTGFRQGFDGREYESSSGSNTNYLTDIVILQSGDRYSFQYGSAFVSRGQERQELAGNTRLNEPVGVLPVVYKAPFVFNASQSCNAWIKDYLPRDSSIVRDARYPAHWWKSVDETGKPDWEILPQEAGDGEVILSKRHELGLLSNFAATPFTYRGKRYASLEGFWQMMLYPEGPNDPRAQIPSIEWRYTRDQVSQMTAFEAKSAGTLAEQNMKRMGIDWVTFEAKRFKYRSAKPGEHYRLIVEATREKVRQNPEVRRVLTATGDLVLKPDHYGESNAPPEWRYYEILMTIRKELRNQR